MITVRRSEERGYAEHGWLKSYHTFSFANYYDPKHTSFAALRVINEDFVAPGKGFDTHPHKNMEIITYPISGTLRHADSLGSQSDISHGTIQRISAGTGVYHSEFNPSPSEAVHLLQIWIEPNQKNVPPRYDEVELDLSANKAVLIASPDGANGSMPIYQDARIWSYAGTAEWDFTNSNKRPVWIQIISGQIKLGDLTLKAGDAAAVNDEASLKLTPTEQTELLLFELNEH